MRQAIDAADIPAELLVSPPAELSGCDIDSGIRLRVNENPHPSRLGEGLHHETHQAHSGANHTQALGACCA